MTAELNSTSTKVPIGNNQSVEVASGHPWPSAYRGSRYSIVTHEEFDDPVLKWEQRDLTLYTEPPAGLADALQEAGKRGGYGSVRITARGEVLTKVPADTYIHLDEAPVSDGWVPVYTGMLSGEIDFGPVNSNPTPPSDGVRIWPGIPFHHGERWSVGHDGTLVWKWRDYRFESAFDHPELVAAYDAYRPNPGRLYITEYGHIWINVPRNDVAPGKKGDIQDAVTTWKETAETNDDTTTLRLVNRRLVATSQSDDPADGHLPIHIGHLRDFDDGVVPRPVVEDETYYVAVAEYETVWE